MPDLRDTIQSISDSWDQFSQDSRFKNSSPDKQAEARHWFFRNQVVGNPVIKENLPKDPTLGPKLQGYFFRGEQAQFDRPAEEAATRITAQPLTRGLGIPEGFGVDSQAHPYLYGAAKFAEGMTSLEQLGLIGATAGAGAAVGAGAKVAGVAAENIPAITAGTRGLIDAGFSLDMIYTAGKQVPQVWNALGAAQELERQGRIPESQEQYNAVKTAMTQMALGGFFAATTAAGARNHLTFAGDWAKLDPEMRSAAIRGGLDPLNPNYSPSVEKAILDAKTKPPVGGTQIEERPHRSVARGTQVRGARSDYSGPRMVVTEEDLAAGRAKWEAKKSQAESQGSPIPRPPEAAARPEEVVTQPTPGTEPLKDKVPELPPLQKEKEGGMKVTSASAMDTINRDLERRGINPPGKNLGRRAEDILTKEPGVNDVSEFISKLKKIGINDQEIKDKAKLAFPQFADQIEAGFKARPEDRPNIPTTLERKQSEMRARIQEGKDADVIFNRGKELKTQGLDAQAVRDQLAHEFPDYAKSIGKGSKDAIINENTARAEVRRSAEAAQTTEPGTKPVQAPESPSGPREPVRPAERPTLKPADFGSQLLKIRKEFPDMELPTAQRMAMVKLLHDTLPDASKKQVLKLADEELTKLRTGIAKQAEADRTRPGSDNPAAVDAKMREAKGANPVLGEEGGLGTPKSQDNLIRKIQDLAKKNPEHSEDLNWLVSEARRLMSEEEGSLNFTKLRQAISGPNSPNSSVSKMLASLQRISGLNPEQQTTENILRNLGGYRSRMIDQLYSKFRDVMLEHENDKLPELIAFNNAAEHKPGSVFLHPQDQAVADSIQDIFQNTLWPMLKATRPDKFHGVGIENYMGRLFKGKRSQAIAEGTIFSRRPIEGGKAFTKHRFHEWIDESITAGADPVTTNPIKMQLLVMNQVVKYISAQKAFRELSDNNLIDYVKLGGTPPQGWSKINDSLFQPRVMRGGGRTEFGNYWAHPDVARVFNRWLAPGLRGHWQYDMIREIGDTMNMMQLGFSAFHFSFTLIAGAVTTDVSLALQQMMRGDFTKGLGSIGNTIMPWKTYTLGHMMEEEWLASGTHPWLSKYADLAQEVGGKLGSGLLQERERVQAFKELPTLGKVLRPDKLAAAVAEFSSRKLMRYWVPRLKMGMFARMAEDKYDRLLAQGATRDQIRTEVGKLWDSVDNRAGLMVYDNRFINRTSKDVLQLSVRSTGWNWGTNAELGGGMKDIGKFIGQKAFHQKNAELSARAAYTIALPIVAGTLGAAMNYIAGQPIQRLEDYFYPKTGGTDASGNPSRLSLPTYMKDVFAYANDFPKGAAQTVIHKLHPMLQQLAELYANQDFYGVEIRHEGDDFSSQVLDVAKYLAKGFVPIGIQATLQRAKQEDTIQGKVQAALESELGLTPAPKYIGETKAEEDAYLLAKRHRMAGPRTQANWDKYQLLTRFEQKFDKGTLKTEDLNAALQSGQLSFDDVDRLFQDRSLSSFQRNFKALELDEAFRVMKEATKDERAELYEILEEHYLNKFESLTPQDQDRYGQLLQGYAP